MRSADTTGKTPSAKLPFGAVVMPVTAKNATAPVPLAFGMKLTPVADPQASQTPSAAPSPQPPQSEAQSQPATPAAAAPAPVEAQSEPAAPQAEPEPSKPIPASSPSTVDTKIQKEPAGHTDAAPIVTAAAATAGSSDNAGDFARQLPATIGTITVVTAPAANKISSPSATTEPTPVPEPLAPSTPAQPAAPLKEIAVRIATPQTPAVDVHVAERAGQIHVAVRTADGGMQTSLRQDLGTLVNSLERSGYRAEAFAPRDASPAPAAQTNSQNSRQDSESGAGGRNGNSGDASQNSGGGQQQQRRAPRPSNWIEELENQQ